MCLVKCPGLWCGQCHCSNSFLLSGQAGYSRPGSSRSLRPQWASTVHIPSVPEALSNVRSPLKYLSWGLLGAQVSPGLKLLLARSTKEPFLPKLNSLSWLLPLLSPMDKTIKRYHNLTTVMLDTLNIHILFLKITIIKIFNGFPPPEHTHV